LIVQTATSKTIKVREEQNKPQQQIEQDTGKTGQNQGQGHAAPDRGQEANKGGQEANKGEQAANTEGRDAMQHDSNLTHQQQQQDGRQSEAKIFSEFMKEVEELVEHLPLSAFSGLEMAVDKANKDYKLFQMALSRAQEAAAEQIRVDGERVHCRGMQKQQNY
jgi:hypothetical protein